ncbi:MAG: glycosyltransferase family 9 protein [Rhizobacter sp.]|nr:glycosyltransferase family 9 protein [Chlorobiales bacterium]
MATPTDTRASIPQKYLTPWFRTKRKVRRFGYRVYYHFFRLLFPTKQFHDRIPVAHIKRVLIIRYDVLGDMIVTTPIFNALHDAGITIDVIAGPRNAMLIAPDERIANIILYKPTFEFWLKLFKLRRRNYDVIFSLIETNPIRQAFMLFIAGTSHTRGVSTFRKDVRAHAFFNQRIRVPGQLHRHIIIRWLKVLEGSIDFGHSIMDSPVDLRYSSCETVSSFLESVHLSTGKYVVVNIASGRPETAWPPEKFTQLLDHLWKKTSLGFVVISTDKEQQDAARIVAVLSEERIVQFAPTKNIFEIIDLIARSAAVITPDTSIVHLASALQKPVVALYTWIGSGHPKEWSPYRVPHRIVVAMANAPVSEISVEEVTTAFHDLWQEVESPSEKNTQR